MRWFTWLRYIAYARRAVLALERLALAQESVAQIALERQQRASALSQPRPLRAADDPVTTFEQLDQEAADELWRRMEQEAGREV